MQKKEQKNRKKQKEQNWFDKSWKVIGGLGAVVALLVGLFELVDIFQGLRAGTETLPTVTSSSTPFPTDTPIPTVSPTPTLRPFQFLAFPSQVRVGQDVEVILQARPGDVCVLEYYTPNGSKSSTDGLGTVTVNSQAKCVWKWHVSANTEPGLATLVITIQDIQETYKFDILPKE
ncbi:MAG: hypothetical protein HYZ22_02470 [Chloroflexi bacterium]|nr:hypothetical protein [Chloroflexota bacterium]